MHYSVYLRRNEAGKTVIENGSIPGVYRLEVGDTTLFHFSSKLTLRIFDGVTTVLVNEKSFVWKIPGPYRLILTENFESEKSDSFWDPLSVIVVSPRSRIAPRDLKMLTVMPRRLGRNWPAELAKIKARGYNAIHLTPMQTCGPSQSGYSISDFLVLDPLMFPEGWAGVKQKLNASKLFAITDVVLNHASSPNSHWLTPNSTYSLSQCPHLLGAFELDFALSEIGQNLDCEEYMQKIRQVIENFNFFDFFKIDRIRSSIVTRTPANCSLDSLTSLALEQVGCSRSGVVLEFENSAQMDQIDAFLCKLAHECIASATEACIATVHYERVVCGKKNARLPRYFSALGNGDGALNNGWVMNWPAGRDFAAPGHHLVYMQRHVVVWEDCVKLRYSEDLWPTMEQYVSLVAENFDGIRLDNCHSTPLFVLQRLLRVMRSVNPHLVVMAELFVGDGGNERAYEATLGLDLLVRESMQVNHFSDWIHTLRSVYSPVMMVPSLSSVIPLHATPHATILYDATHDNPTVGAKFGNPDDALLIAVLVCSAPCAIGSSEGFDSMAAVMPSVVCPAVEGPIHKSNDWIDWEVFGEWDGWKRGVAFSEFDKQEGCEYKLRKGFEWRCDPNVGIATSGNNIAQTVGTLCGLKKILNDLHSEISGFRYFSAKLHHSKILEIKRQNNQTFEAYHFYLRLGECDFAVSFALDTQFESILLATSLLNGQLMHFKPEELNFTSNTHQISLHMNCALLVMKTKPVENFEQNLVPPLAELSGRDFSHLLFGCDQEDFCYHVPDHGRLVFAGFAGIQYLMESYLDDDSFSESPVGKNIKNGDWLFDFLGNRILQFPAFSHWYNDIVGSQFKSFSNELKPRMFRKIVGRIYNSVVAVIVDSARGVGKTTCESSDFVNSLIVASYQFTYFPTVAAGLPHFSNGYMRCWGRDTFISFTGLFLVTGRFAEARNCLLQFASVVRHGLVPNLFDDGHNPRFNARDAVWCFLHSVCNYVDITKDSNLMESIVELKYGENAYFKSPGGSVKFRDIYIGLLQSHWEGIDFIEWNAGRAIDEYMQEKGFHVEIFVDKKTGLIYGGNEFNCGTWMDKMGSVYGNSGVPATPRNGAAVEINALALRVLKWIDLEIFKEWKEKLSANFFPSFFNDFDIDVVPNRHQLRPNGCWALAVVPIDCVPNVGRAREYLKRCKNLLVGPLGMKTLSPDDPDYNGVYDNNDETRGYNYHNGPEWGWLLGYYMIACKRFGLECDILDEVQRHIKTSAWRSLPELTNQDGAFCHYSCPSQAWSVCTLLESCYRN